MHHLVLSLFKGFDKGRPCWSLSIRCGGMPICLYVRVVADVLRVIACHTSMLKARSF
jgi:hypothetical protein